MPYIVVATYTSSHEAHLARARLEGEGIRCSVESDPPPYARRGRGAFAGIELAVELQDLDAAKAILSEVDRALTKQAMASPTCPYCRSDDVKSVGVPALFVVLSLGWLAPLEGRLRCRDCGRRWRSSRSPGHSRVVRPEGPEQ